GGVLVHTISTDATQESSQKTIHVLFRTIPLETRENAEKRAAMSGGLNLSPQDNPRDLRPEKTSRMGFSPCGFYHIIGVDYSTISASQ
ncbi:MAG: hypothetical protein NTZ17_09775, partial [Phycisphaerae bacterium]|nr:hypothetical protein [Phycisphaerae bacterium]